MKRLILPALALLAMASCSRQEILGEYPGDGTERIVFGSAIGAATRVRDDAATAFENDERIGVFGYRMAAAGATTDFTQDLFLDQVEFTYDATTPGAEKFASPHTDAVWKLGNAHNFYAYYPTTLTVTNAATGATAPLTVVEGTGIDAANDVMVANVSTPVYQGKKKSEELAFRHVLSKVKFKIKKETAITPDVELTNVTFDMKSNAGSVNLMTGLVTHTPGGVTLHNGDAPAAQDVTSVTATPIPGSWLVLPDDEVSEMIFTLDGQQMKVSGAAIPTAAGQITLITITVKANAITFTATITPWGEDEKDAPDLEPVITGPIIKMGNAPFNLTGVVNQGSTNISYNSYYGNVKENGANGTYYENETDWYANEKPYHCFEVAGFDAYDAKGGDRSWVNMIGRLADHSDGICVQTHGTGWRFPRLSELRLMYENIVALNGALGEGALDPNDLYWSGSESQDYVCVGIILKTGELFEDGEYTNRTGRVRCIKEVEK